MKSKRKPKPKRRSGGPRSRGLWIAPGLERTIKGESGQRGLVDQPYNYYLQLADLALKNVPAGQAEPAAPVRPALEQPRPPKVSVPKHPPVRPSKNPVKLSLPKPSQRPSTPKPPKPTSRPKPPRRRK